MVTYEEFGEEWIPYHAVWKLYRVKKEKLDELVANKTVRFVTECNRWNNQPFKAYSVNDLDRYTLNQNKKRTHKKADWFY